VRLENKKLKGKQFAYVGANIRLTEKAVVPRNTRKVIRRKPPAHGAVSSRKVVSVVIILRREDVKIKEKSEMGEKKMTDEEIVKALECCGELDNCFDCQIMGEMKRRNFICREVVLDLIHRLQDENEQLKCNSYTTSWKGKFFEAKKEIERLTEELKYYRGELL
jgi:hypothetical protein